MVRLGQNFLADTNLLEAIARHAELCPDEVVLEVGAGEGALTRLLGERAGRVWAIELDEGLRPELAGVAERARAPVELILGDAMDVDLGGLEPPPTVMVSNLPYSIATPLLIRTIVEVPTIARWVVMVQREVGDRLRAAPGSRLYGAPSAIVQLACEVEMLRAVDPAVFRPRPRVESALLGLRRIDAPPPDPVREVVRAAFAHRRKALARSLELAAPSPAPARVREAAQRALREMGLPSDARAEALTPRQLRQLAETILPEAP